jgi:hypothetical protein
MSDTDPRTHEGIAELEALEPEYVRKPEENNRDLSADAAERTMRWYSRVRPAMADNRRWKVG